MSEAAPSTAMTVDQYALSHPEGVERHYWHRARNQIVLRKLEPYLTPDSHILDIGCGPGITVAYLREQGVDCYGVDLGTPPVAPALEAFVSVGVSAFDMAAEFREQFTVLCCLDVLEHMPNPAEFVMQCEAAFPSVRTLFVTVPARMEIWGNYDEFFGHYHRYAAAELPQLAAGSSFELQSSGYFFRSLYAAARAMKLLNRKRSLTSAPPRPDIAHYLLGKIFDWEERLVPSSVHGSSLFAVFTKEKAHG